MTRYRADFPFPVAFEEQTVRETMAEVLAEHGVRQLHLAETEKYAHVTYFFNGGDEHEWEGETRILVPSPRDVPTYDKKPEMSAHEVARRFVEEIPKGYRFAIVNFANPDMVGHTGVIPAVVRAVETVDACLGQVLARRSRGSAASASSRPTTGTPSSSSRRTASARTRRTRRTRFRSSSRRRAERSGRAAPWPTSCPPASTCWGSLSRRKCAASP